MSRADVTRHAPLLQEIVSPKAMTFLPEIGRKCAGEFLPNGRAVAGSNDGHDRNVGEIEPPLDAEQRGRRIDLSKRRRIAWLSDSDEARAQTLGDCKLGFGVFLAAKADVMDAPATARQRGQRVDGGLCAAEFVDQGPERRRTDIPAPDQPG
jgi:hypothetical protein